MKLILMILSIYCHSIGARDYTEIGLKILEHYSDEILNSAENGTECVDQLKLLFTNVQGRNRWALEMIDSSAKLQAGLLVGNINNIGNYDECLDINTYSNGSFIMGQYCTVTIEPNLAVEQCVEQQFLDNNITTNAKISMQDVKHYGFLKWGLCVPTVCSVKDLQNIWDFTEKRYEIKFHLLFIEERCSSKHTRNEITLLDILAIGVFGSIGFLILLSTCYDIFIFQKKEDKKLNVYVAFSFYTNGKRLFSSNKREDTVITCLYGIRTISIAWVVLGHRFLFYTLATSINNKYLLQWLQHEENMFIIGAFASVDTFLVISGFLIAYVNLLAKEKEVPINLLVFYGHRWLRLTPALAGIILVQLGPILHFGSGPLWYNMHKIFTKDCLTCWWLTINYIQNYINPVKQCVPHSWYLAVDTQLYLLSPLFFIPLQKWPRITICFILGIIIACILGNIYAIYYYDIVGTSLNVLDLYMKYIYTATHLRISPWLAGMLLGYFIFQYRNKKINFIKKYVIMIWLFALFGMLSVLYGYMAVIKYNVGILGIALFNGFSRIIWGICICWIIFACTTGYGGFVQTFLSLPIFRVLSRLTYSIYLTHILVIFTVKAQMKTNSYASNLFQFYEVWGDYAFTVGISLIWTLIFESPVTVLESVLIKRELNKRNSRIKSIILKTISFKT